MAYVTITTTTMGFRIQVSKTGEIAGSPLNIYEYSKRFEHWQWDQQTQRRVLMNCWYYHDQKQDVVYFPKFDLPRFLEFLKSHHVVYEIVEDRPVYGENAAFHMLPFVDYKNDKQKNAIAYLTDSKSGPIRGLALQTGLGKLQPLDAKIRTPSGWVCNGDLQIGDLLTMPDGTVAPVAGIFPQGMQRMYRLTFQDGRSTESGDDHLWKVKIGVDAVAWDILTLAELRNIPEDIYIPIADPALGPGQAVHLESIEYIGEKDSQCIMVDHPENLYITDDYIVTHNTVSLIWSVQKLERRTLISMTSRLEQWVDEIAKYTTLDAVGNDMYVVQGVASLTKLFNQIDDLKPKFILISTKTLRLYLDYGPNYQHLPHPSEMCAKLGIGIVAADEAHEHFFTNYLAGLLLNPGIWIPTTATFVANDPFVKTIFDAFYPKVMQFTGGEYEKYVNVTAYVYEGGALDIKPYHYKSRQGYSQVMFEKYLMSKKGQRTLENFIDSAILPIVKTHYINVAEKGEKFLLLCATKDLCDYLQGVFRREFKDKTVSVFYSGMPVNTLERFDMVLSTPGSAGTGRDIKNLRSCLVVEATGSEIRNLQFIGRLRRMKNVPEFSYIAWRCVSQHLSYHQQRSFLYGPRAVKFQHRTIG